MEVTGGAPVGGAVHERVGNGREQAGLEPVPERRDPRALLTAPLVR